MDILDIRIIDIVDIILVALLLYYLYKLVKGTVAINIFIGIVILYVVWKVTEFLQMEMLSRFLAGFKDIFLILIVIVFQQEIRKFLLMLGTTNVTARRKLFKRLNLFSENESSTNIPAILGACSKMGKSQTGAIIVLQRNNSLEFVKIRAIP